MGYAIIISAEKCSGCQMCEVACSLRNMRECNPERSRIRVVKSQQNGQLEFVPSTCMQCETAMCELVCPVSAISRDTETGARIINEKRCIGCSSCGYASADPTPDFPKHPSPHHTLTNTQSPASPIDAALRPSWRV